MNEEIFGNLLESVRQMAYHMRGEQLEGIKVREFPEVEPRTVRETVGVSQGEFARILGVPVKTLQNWEQHRNRPTGPARTLLRMIARDPTTAIRLLTA